MSEPTRLPPSGSGANTPIGARTLTSTANALAGRLQIGMQVELIPTRSITPEVIETQLRPVGGAGSWTSSVRAQLTTALPANGLQAAVNERPGSGAMPMLRAEVVATSPTLVLRLVSAADRPMPIPGQAAVSGAGSREWLGQQFRQHWPESRPVAATLDRIAVQLANESAGNPITAPTSATNTETTGSLQRAITTLIGQLATVTELTDPEQLAVAVSRSGVWLESLLAHAAIDPAQSNGLRLDLKAQLLTLAQRLRVQEARPPSLPPPGLPTAGRHSEMSAPQLGPPQAGAPPTPVDTQAASRSGTTPEPAQPVTTEDGPTEAAHRTTQDNQRTASLAREVEGMLKQVVTKQLQSLDSTAGQTQWLLELPFRTPTGLQALDADIRREQARGDKEHDTWSMRLRLDLPKLGPLHIVLTLRDEWLNASLQAADAGGAEQIKQHLGDLRARLEAREIQVASLHAGHRPLDRPAPPFNDPLVREQA
jgi:hypothetical protein